MEGSSINTEAHGHNCHVHDVKEDNLRRRLKFFFMNPCEKWHAKRKFPWKLVLQLIKIILVTIQLGMFGVSRSAHVTFIERTVVSFKHLFLKDWTSSFETMPYPPAAGPFAVYTKSDFYSSIDHICNQYSRVEDIAIGTYQFDSRNDTNVVKLCKERYRKGRIWPDQTYEFDSHIETECFEIKPVLVYNDTTHEVREKYDIQQYLNETNYTISFDRLIKAKVKFSLKSVHLRDLASIITPDCYRFNITVTYDNSGHNGQTVIDLASDQTPLVCTGKITSDNQEEKFRVFSTIYDVTVILASVASMLLCIRSLYRAHQLQMETVKHFKTKLGRELSCAVQLDFVNCWYVLIILNDVLTIVGSAYKVKIENKLSRDYEVCGVTLGTGNLLVWFGLLRYLGFFEKYNILILTLKKSVPSVLRFLVCAGVFYFGFTVCGWVVLGPYHIKFRTLSTASECLFSLINGDDMFVTFAAINNQVHTYVWWYSRVFLYVFIALFIYVVLSVFISVIMDTYETIKDFYIHGFPKSEMQIFIDECTDEPHLLFSSSNSQTEERPCFCACLSHLCCKPRADVEVVPNENTALL